MYLCGHVNSDHGVDDSGTLVVTCHTTAIGCYQVIRLDGREILEITTRCPNLIGSFKGQWSGEWFGKSVNSRMAINLDTEFKEGRINLVGDLKMVVKNLTWELISIPMSGQFNEDNTLTMAETYMGHQILLDGAVEFDSKGGTIKGNILIDGKKIGTFSIFSPVLKEVSFWR